MIFYVGLRTWVSEKAITRNIALLPVASLLAFPYIIEYYIYFEQVLLPVSFALQAIGWLLLFLRKPSLLHVFCIIWTLTMMSSCYTPALGVEALFIVILAIIGLSNKYSVNRLNLDEIQINGLGGDRAYYVCILATVLPIISVIMGITIGRGDRVAAINNSEHIIADIISAYKQFLFNSPIEFTGIYVGVIIAYIIISLTFRVGLINFIVAAWTLSIVGLTQALRGFSLFRVEMSMSRSIIVIPVLVAMVSLTIFSILSKQKTRISKFSLSVFLIINVMYGLYYTYNPKYAAVGVVYNEERFNFLEILETDLDNAFLSFGLKHSDQVDVILAFDRFNVGDLPYVMEYGFPNATYKIINADMPLPDDIGINRPAIIYTTEGQRPNSNIGQRGHDEVVKFRYLDSEISVVRKVIKPDIS